MTYEVCSQLDDWCSRRDQLINDRETLQEEGKRHRSDGHVDCPTCRILRGALSGISRRINSYNRKINLFT